MKRNFKLKHAADFRIILLIVIGLTFTILTAAVADSTEMLWKIRVKGFSSPNGNVFLETAEYLGPTTSFTNLAVNEASTSYDFGLPGTVDVAYRISQNQRHKICSGLLSRHYDN
jgi:hypothetical protein